MGLRRYAVLAIAGLALAACSGGPTGDALEATARSERTPATVLGNVIERASTTTTPALAAPGSSTTARSSAPAEVTPTSCQPKDDDCDGWWWSTDPGPNRPISLTVDISPATPEAGKELTILVRAADPDARLQPPVVCITGDHYTREARGGSPTWSESCIGYASCTQNPSGEVATPARAPSDGEWTFRHTFEQSGTYEIDVWIESSTRTCNPDPYASDGRERRTLLVA